MSTRVVERVDGWSERSFSGGYRELRRLADGDFSGVVRANGAELYMTNGTVVGVRQGSIEDFEEAEGQAFAAPSAALPLLAVMQERSDEVRAKYYTEDTPISEVDRTLSGGFSGFVELSENVLSGDYYLVYHGGRSMSVAFVGNSGRMLDGDEAFETADDEVGIYEVRPVDVEPVEIPESEEEETAGAAAAAGASAGGAATESGAADTDGAEPTDDTGAERGADESATPESTGTAEADAAADGAGAGTAGHPGGGSDTQTAAAPDGAAPAKTDRTDGEGAARASSAAESAPPTEKGGQPEPSPPEGRPEDGSAGDATAAAERTAATESAERAAEFPLETRAVPSLDPELTTPTEDHGGPARADSTAGEPRDDAPTERRSRGGAGNGREPDPEPRERRDPAGATGGESGRVSELREELADRESQIERLEEKLDAERDQREALETDLASVREERDELQAEVERLEAELEEVRAELGAATDAERRLTPSEALSGTDIFVRYGSKGKATLEKARAGEAGREAVHQNLRLEKHTQFDAESAAVGGQRYGAFLEETLAYGFVRWVVMELLFEIRDTGTESGMADLYDALPEVDRAELKGTVAVVAGEGETAQQTFDVVLRDRMGDPLLVADLNDSREAASEGMMEGLITAAEQVGQTEEGFSGAFLVTSSFFEPEALEVASEATAGGLLSRDKRKSFVNLSRKRGYHLCLVEARKGNFSLAVPDL
jgi:hypothetical protein